MTVPFNDKFNSLPEALQQEVMQFIDFLLFKKQVGQNVGKKEAEIEGQEKKKPDSPSVAFAEWPGVTPGPEKNKQTPGKVWTKGLIPLPAGFHGSLEKYPAGFGGAKGMFVMSPDFDEPLEDFKEYMY